MVNPQFNAERVKQGLSSPEVALQAARETDAGVIVNGARLLATLGPLANDIEVFPSTLLKAAEANIPFALAFTIPIATPGISPDLPGHLRRRQVGVRRLRSRRALRKWDAVVIFDNVLVPWERHVHVPGPAAVQPGLRPKPMPWVHMMHQVACGKLAKAEFIVGLLCAMAQASGKDKDANVKGQIAEAMWVAETVRALLFAAEQQPRARPAGGCGSPSVAHWTRPATCFPRLYPKLVETVQLLGSSSLMATPCEADFSGAIADDVHRYFELTNLGAKDRVALFRLAHDVAISGFGSRQVLYERFFFGSQNVMASVYYDLYDKDEMMDRVTALLNQS